MRKLWLVLLLTMSSLGLAQSLQTDNLTTIHFIDVGLGDSILIHSAEGTTVLIDGGYNNDLAINYLRALGISRLDAVFASHPHADHIGGLVSIMDTIPTASVWTSGALHTTSTFERFLDVIEKHQIPYYETQAGEHIEIGDLQFDVLYGRSQAANLNNTSLVLRLVIGEVSFLFTGDAEAQVERELIQSLPAEQLQTTVLKVGHHGSGTSSRLDFLQVVQPTIAVYSASRGNSYGHPHRATIENLQTVGASIYGTDRDGTVVISTDGLDISVQTQATFVELVDSTQEAAPQGAEALALPYDVNGPDRDCGGFDSHAEAQAFFIAAGEPQSDHHGLDGDNDGIACESLP